MAVPVKLPKEVLDLFPQWEYRCSRCGTFAEPPLLSCVNCGNSFDEAKWRVPPRFLESQETMSEYAHKVLAPKLSSEQRNLLFLYFTELFSDGFESGNFNAWDAVTANPSAVGSPVHHGSYSMFCNAYGYCYKNVTAQDHLNFRIYVKWSALPTAPNDRIMLVRDGGTEIFRVYYHYSVGLFPVNNVGFSVHNVLKSGWSGHYDVDVGTDWVCVEVEYNNGADGYVKLYVDGVERISDSYNFGSQQASRVFCIHDHFSSFTINFDCAVVADTYVGLETSEQTYTKTWTNDSLFKKLGIPKAVNLDVALQKQGAPKSFGLDALLQKSLAVQVVADAVFKRVNVSTVFGLDACFGGLATNVTTKQIDVVLKKLGVSEAFGLDAYFGSVDSQTHSVSFGLNSVFAYKVRLPELWLDENGKIVFNISKPFAWVGLP